MLFEFAPDAYYRKDGTPVPVAIKTLPARSGHRRLVLGIAHYVSEHGRGERMRGRFTERLLAAQEEERGRIARELHDQTAQSLTALLVGLRHLEDAATIEEARSLAAELRERVRRMVDAVRRLARGLRPEILDELGFQAAVEQYLNEYWNGYGLIERTDSEARMIVEDDGCGSMRQNDPHVREGGPMGLCGIRQRLASLGGHCILNRRRAKGAPST